MLGGGPQVVRVGSRVLPTLKIWNAIFEELFVLYLRSHGSVRDFRFEYSDLAGAFQRL